MGAPRPWAGCGWWSEPCCRARCFRAATTPRDRMGWAGSSGRARTRPWSCVVGGVAAVVVGGALEDLAQVQQQAFLVVAAHQLGAQGGSAFAEAGGQRQCGVPGVVHRTGQTHDLGVPHVIAAPHPGDVRERRRGCADSGQEDCVHLAEDSVKVMPVGTSAVTDRLDVCSSGVLALVEHVLHFWTELVRLIRWVELGEVGECLVPTNRTQSVASGAPSGSVTSKISTSRLPKIRAVSSIMARVAAETVSRSWGATPTRSGRPVPFISSPLPLDRPTTASKSSRQSRADLANGPSVSSDRDNGSVPSAGTAPRVVFRPVRPAAVAGPRIDPPVSDPSDPKQSPAAVAEAQPLEDVPTQVPPSQGFTGTGRSIP